MTLLAKVCGLVRPEDAAQAAEAGADLLGFVVHPPSPRHCADLGVASPHLDRAVLVQVAERAEAVLLTARRHGFRRVQPHLPPGHRAAGATLLREAGLFVLLPWPDEPGQDPAPADLYLWEPSPARTGVAGGSGQTHGMGHPPPGPFLLAGGLTGAGLPTRWCGLPGGARFLARGRKDPGLVAEFITAVHALELP